MQQTQAEQEICSGLKFCLFKRASFADVLKCLRYQEIREMINRSIFKVFESLLKSP